ncbi:hypothetical protein ACHWQZ_G016561 [Mnemiopsis leidyi]
MRMLPAVLLLALSLAAHAQEFDQDHFDCSHGNLQYLCENYETCFTYGLIDEETYAGFCAVHLDPVPEGEGVDGSTETPQRRENTIQMTTSRGNVGALTSSKVDGAGDLTSSRDAVTYGDSTTDNRIVTVGATDRAISDYRGTTDGLDISTPYFTEGNGIVTGTFATQENGVDTQGPTEGNTRDFKTFSAAPTRDIYTVTGTDSFDVITDDLVTEPNESVDLSTSAKESDFEDRKVTVSPSESNDFDSTERETNSVTRVVTITPTDDSYTTESDNDESDNTERPTVYDDFYTTERKTDSVTRVVTITPTDDSYSTETETDSVTRVETETPTDDYYTTADFYSTVFQTDDAFTTPDSLGSTEATTEEAPIVGVLDPELSRPPVITEPPRNITVPPGGTGRFDCTARAATTPQITITKKDQTTVPDLNNFKAANGNGLSQTTINSITINNVDLPNEGWYTCQAVNKYGYVRQDAYLHIKDLCEGVVCPGERICKGNYDEGEGHTCECPQFCDYTELIVPDYVCSNYCEEHFNECAMKTDACNNDKFAIEVLNSGRCGYVEQPEILQAEEEYGVKDMIPGETLFLECHANGFPEPNIVWYRGTDVVGSGNELSLTVNEEDAGEYICEAVNCMRSKVSKRLALVFVTEITTPPMPTTASTSATPTVEIQPGENTIPDPPRSTCAVFGDPHFLTYDQRAYSYMGTCDNVLAMDCEMARWFVYGRMRPCGRSGGSCLETVTVYVDYEILELQRGWLVNRNGGKIVPKNHPNKKIIVEGRRNNFTLEFDGAILTLSAVLNKRPYEFDPNQMLEDKLVVHWDGYVSVQIQTPQNTRTCGMCGDNDANPDNDMKTRRRGLTNDPVEFGDSWKIDPRGRCEETNDPRTPEEVCGDQYEEARTECERIFNIPKFQNCRDNGGHDTTAWIESCIYDHCEGLMQQEQLPPKCIVAGAYATRCGHDFWDREYPFPTRTEQVKGWEAEAGCPTADERFQPVLDTGCPQPTLEEELAGNFK